MIVTDYRAKYRRTSDNEVQLKGKWRFSPTESTGTFEDLTGHGSLKAILTCLAHVRDPSTDTCAERGHFTDFVGLRGDTTAPAGETTPGLMGHYRDPTVETALTQRLATDGRPGQWPGRLHVRRADSSASNAAGRVLRAHAHNRQRSP